MLTQILAVKAKMLQVDLLEVVSGAFVVVDQLASSGIDISERMRFGVECSGELSEFNAFGVFPDRWRGLVVAGVADAGVLAHRGVGGWWSAWW